MRSGPGRRLPPLSEEEWIVLLDYFFYNPEPTHTDSHPMCQQLAQLIGRSASSVERSLRNIKHIATGSIGQANASRLARHVHEVYSVDQHALHSRAEELVEQFQLRRGQQGPDERQLAFRRICEFNNEHRNQAAPSISRDTTVFHRPRGARADLLLIVGTTCQICLTRGFATRLGATYAEVHHIDELARRNPGNLCSDNAIVLCPTCHAKLHNANVAFAELPQARIRITINGYAYVIERNTEARLEALLGTPQQTA